MSVNITKYIGQIKELERLTGAKFTGTEPNPNSKANSEQYAVFTHQELKQPKKVGLHYLNDRIRAVKNGYNIFTANSKSNQQLNNVHSSLLSKQELISTQNPSKKCLLSKLIFKASAITKTDTHWKTIGTKLKTADAIKLEQLALDLNTTPSALLRGYVEALLKLTKLTQ